MQPVRDVMDTFILQGGHPLVTLHGDRCTSSRSPWTGPRRLPRRPSGRSGGSRWPSARSAPADSPGAPVRHLLLGADPRPSRTRPHAGSPWSMPEAGGCSGSATRRSTGWRSPGGWPSSTPLERSNLLADTWATTLAGLTSLEEFVTSPRNSGSSPTRRPGPPWGPRSHLGNGSLARATRTRSTGGRRARRPHTSPSRLRRRARRERPHADAARRWPSI